MEVTQTVTSNKDSIPAHYVALSSYGCHKGNTEQKASAEYKLLYRAWKNELMGGIKFMANPHDKHGKIFVDPADAERVIAAGANPAPAISALSPNLAGDSASLNAALSMAEMRLTLSRIELILDRLAGAAEKIAEAL
jgi:hypothetical protein